MLPRQHRLTAKRDFERASRGRPVPAPHFTLRVALNGLSVTRVGIVVGLKVSKRAHIRNRVKRLIREVFQRHLPSIRAGIDIVVHTKTATIGVEFGPLASEIGAALTRSRLLVSPWVDNHGISVEKE